MITMPDKEGPKPAFDTNRLSLYGYSLYYELQIDSVFKTGRFIAPYSLYW